MKLCYLELHIRESIVEYLQNGTVKMLDIGCGGSLRCVKSNIPPIARKY